MKNLISLVCRFFIHTSKKRKKSNNQFLNIIGLFARFALSYDSRMKNRLIQLQVTQILKFKQ